MNVSGAIAAGTSLTIDANGGQNPNPQDAINLSGGSHAFISQLVNGVGTITDITTGGKINLTGFHTAIIGSAYGDTISDDSTGTKQIDGGLGNDTISVFTGAGILFGGDGDDILTGGAKDDLLIGGAGTDQLSGGTGSDTLISGTSGSGSVAEILDGGSGSDRLVSQGSNVTLRGGRGNDLFEGSAYISIAKNDGQDELIGTIATRPADSGYAATTYHEFNDLIDLSAWSINEVEFIWNAAVVARSQTFDEYLLKGDLAIVIKSTGQSILLRDVIGQRQYRGSGAGDPIHANGHTNGLIYNMHLPGLHFSDTDTPLEDGISYIDFYIGPVSAYDHAAADFAAATTGGGGTNLNGTSGPDELYGSTGSEALSGRAGDDSFGVSGGSDSLDGGIGFDTVNLFGPQSAFLFTRDTPGLVKITDTRTGDVLSLTSVEDINFISSNAHFATDELARGSPGDDTLTGNADANTLYGNNGNDIIYGGDGDDMLNGGNGADTLRGEAGNDTLRGNADNDVLIGDTGKDYLVGAAGADQFKFYAGDTTAATSTADRITDFSHAEGDRIDLSAIDAIAGTGAIDAFRFIGTAAFSGSAGELRYAISGSDTLISGDTNGDGIADLLIWLTGNITLVASDFTLSGGSGFVAGGNGFAAPLVVAHGGMGGGIGALTHMHELLV